MGLSGREHRKWSRGGGHRRALEEKGGYGTEPPVLRPTFRLLRRISGLGVIDATIPGRASLGSLEGVRGSINSTARKHVCVHRTPVPRACTPSPEVVLLFLGLVGPCELLHVTPKVCWMWHRLSKTVSNTYAAAAAFEVAIIAGKGVGGDALGRASISSVTLRGDNERRWNRFCCAFPWGKYLSEGAYKKVYQIWNVVASREEAVSVMDIRRIATSGNASIVGQEIACALLLSELVTSGVCPNFVETYQVFQLPRPAPSKLWGTEADPMPLGETPHQVGVASTRVECVRRQEFPSAGPFQYIRMELCGNGDLESHLKRLTGEMMPLPQLCAVMFQMFFSLYVARHRLNFRHYDIKLLNFFAKAVSIPVGLHTFAMRYYFGACHFALPPLDSNFAFFVKLADYGTADTRPETLGMPVTVDQFATLENAPVDFLVLGDRALQHYASDTFCLGLAVLHLFTGSKPYEELLAEVQCPPPLFKDLVAAWGLNRSGRTADFKSIQNLASHDDCGRILANTLYRYIVLFGVDNFVPYSWAAEEPVWRAVLRYAASGKRFEGQGRYFRDRETFSVKFGSHPLLQRARDRMKLMPGSFPLLLQLTAFDPTQRVSMHDALCSPVFDSLSNNDGNASAAFQFAAYASCAALDCTL